MEQVKKNLLSIICGVVALIALLFHVAYTSGKFKTLKTDAEKQVSQISKAQGIMNTTHYLPKVTDAPPPAFPSDKFPNEATTDHNARAIKTLEQAAAGLWNRVVEINTGEKNGLPRPLLVPGSLPAPTDNLGRSFRSEYYRATRFVDRDRYQEVLSNGGGQPNLPMTVLRATVPPTGREIEEARQMVWYDPNGKYITRLQRILGPDGKPTDQASNYPQVAAAFSRETAGFSQQYLQQRAAEGAIYVGTPPTEPGAPTAGLTPAAAAAEIKTRFAENRATAVATALSVNQSINPISDRVPSAQEIWYAQASFWVLQDVCNTIAAMNAGSMNVPSSPVKHLFRFGLPQGPGMYKMPSGQVGAAAAPPPPVDPGDGSTPPPPPAPVVSTAKDFNISPTGRVGNDLYDVVHFTLEVAVDAEYVHKLIQKMQEGRWICVLRADAQLMDLDEAMDLGCFYGSRPVMYVRMECEALFLRDWTVGKVETPQPLPDGSPPPPAPRKPGLMPPAVLRELGSGGTPGGTPAGGTGGAPTDGSALPPPPPGAPGV